jgi:hypothetical protein
MQSPSPSFREQWHMACKVVVHDIAGTRDSSSVAAQEEPSSTANRLDEAAMQGHIRATLADWPRRAHKAPAALLQHAGRIAVSILAKYSPSHLESTTKRSAPAGPSPSRDLVAQIRASGHRQPRPHLYFFVNNHDMTLGQHSFTKRYRHTYIT